MQRKGSAEWRGGLRDGNGTVSTESGVLHGTPYSFGTRFEDGKGTNPEELLAAAHAGCFTMALSAELGKAGITAESLRTTAAVTLEKDDRGFHISAVHLDLAARIAGPVAEAFHQAVETAKANCPVSRLFNAAITLESRLEATDTTPQAPEGTPAQ